MSNYIFIGFENLTTKRIKSLNNKQLIGMYSNNIKYWMIIK